MIKPLLANHLRKELVQVHRSIHAASKKLGVPYERLKKAIQNNAFNVNDLRLLLPDTSVEELSAQFVFRLSRGYGGTRVERPEDLKLRGLEPQDVQFIKENKAVEELIVRMVHTQCEHLRQVLFGDV